MFAALAAALLLSGASVQDGPAAIWRDDPNLAPTLTDPAARARMNAEISDAIAMIVARYETDARVRESDAGLDAEHEAQQEYEARMRAEQAERSEYQAESAARGEAEAAAERERQAWQAQLEALRNGTTTGAVTPPPVEARTRPGPK